MIRAVGLPPFITLMIISSYYMTMKGFPGGSEGKESTCDAGDPGLIPELGKSPGGGHGPTPVFLPGESHGQRSLVGYSPRDHKESDTTESLTHTQTEIPTT